MSNRQRKTEKDLWVNTDEANLLSNERHGVREFLRENDSLTRCRAITICAFSLLLHLWFDVFRCLFLVWLRLSGKGSMVLFASGDNHVANIEKYSPKIAEKSVILRIKNTRSLFSVPQTLLAINGLYRITFTREFKMDHLSYLDLSEAYYKEMAWYLRYLLTFIKCDVAVLSREDSLPFIELGVAAQSLAINLFVFEHGLLTRSYTAFATTETTVHVYSSIDNVRKREPPAANIYRADSPLYSICEQVSQQRLQIDKKRHDVLIADTYNIRDRLICIADALRERGWDVKIRLHPGYFQECGEYACDKGKPEALASAQYVITGISGFCVESVFCGIPTIVLYRPEDEWGAHTLRSLQSAPNIAFVELETFLSNPSKFMTSVSYTTDDFDKWRASMGFFYGELNDAKELETYRSNAD